MSELRRAFHQQQPLLAVESIGCTGYFSELPMLDMLGLTDRHLAHNRPADFGHGFVGHELGDGAYVLSREPDIIMFAQIGEASPWFRGGLELVKLPDFARQYLLVAIKPFGPPLARLWVRWASPRIGVTQSEKEVRIPGILFATPNAATARLVYDRFVTHVGAGSTVTFDRVSLAPGRWTARVIGSGPSQVVVEGSAVRVTAGTNDCEIATVVLTR